MKRMVSRLSRGSILAYSLILLGIIFVASVGMMAASVTNLKSVSSNDKSNNAFQIADSGSQVIIAQLKTETAVRIGDMSGVTCDAGNVATVNASLLGGTYKIIFKDSATPEKILKCNDDVSQIVSVKSVGTYSNTTRAVEVAVAAPTSAGVTGGCTVSSTGVISAPWGTGCKTSGNASPSTCIGASATSSSCGLASVNGTDSICLCIAN